MLTGRQLIFMESNNSAPPLHMSSLHQKFGPGPLSLRTIMGQVEAHKTVFFLQVRDVAILQNVSNPAQLQAAWKGTFPSKATLVLLAQMLSPVGGSIVYLSQDWRTVGLAGTAGGLAGFPCVLLDAGTGLTEVGSGVAAVGGAILAIGLASNPAGWVAIVGAAATGLGGGLAIGGGLVDLGVLNAGDGTGTLDLPEITIYGNIPNDVDPNDVLDLGTIDMSDIPDTPPDTGDSSGDNPGSGDGSGGGL